MGTEGGRQGKDVAVGRVYASEELRKKEAVESTGLNRQGIYRMPTDRSDLQGITVARVC